MRKDETFLNSKVDGRKIHTVFWEPETEPRAVVQIAHGMSEHIGRYEPFASFLCENGIAAAGHDHHGHGQSARGEGDLGFFAEGEHEDAVVRDIRTVTNECKRRFPGLPVFLLGHSMGSFFVRRFLSLYSGELAGAILLGTGWFPSPLAGTGLFLSRAVCRFKGEKAVSPLLERLVRGRGKKAFPEEGEDAWLSSDPETVRIFEADPLCGFPFTAGAYRDFFAVMKSVADEEDYDAVRKTLPVLVASGERDPVGGRKAVEKVAAQYRRLELTDVTAKVFPGDRHEILNEKDRDEVRAYLLGWLNARIR